MSGQELVLNYFFKSGEIENEVKYVIKHIEQLQNEWNSQFQTYLFQN